MSTPNAVRHETPAAYTVVPETQSDDALIVRAKQVLFAQLKARRVEGAPPLIKPEVVRDYLQLELAGRPYEVFCALFLDSQHRLLSFEEMFRGTLDSAAVYPREVARRAILLNAGAVIFAHNHPSGLAEPSDADRRITDRLKEALKLFEIRVLDHLVVGEEVVSFAERGWI